VGRFDPAFVLIYLYPLFILALSYDVLAQERDDRTLALMLAHPVRLAEIPRGKIAARAAAALAPLAVLTLVGVCVGIARGADATTTIGLLMWLLLGAAYSAFWFAVGLAVISGGGSATLNAIRLLAIWLVLTIVVPSLVSVTVGAVAPVPSRLQFIAQMRRAHNDVERLGERALAEYHGDHPELAPPGRLDWDDLQSRFYVVHTLKESRTLPLVSAYEAQLARQQRLVDLARYLSPAILMLEAQNAIAGTDSARFHQFRRQTEAFLDRWRRYAVPRSFRRVHLRSADYDSLPRFSFEEPPLERTVRRAASTLIGLCLPATALAWVGMKRLHRYPVTG
jgi:ABC-2 type transport system permease protein